MILAFGTIWFWVFLVVVVLIIITCLELPTEHEDSGGGTWATIITVIAIGLYWWIGDRVEVKNAFIAIRDNVLTFIFYLFGYYAIGLLWSIAKWYMYLKRYNRKLRTLIEKEGLDTLRGRTLPTASEYKYKIISWMSYWPFSILSTFTFKFIFNGYKVIYSFFGGIFERIENSIIGDLKEEKEKIRRK